MINTLYDIGLLVLGAFLSYFLPKLIESINNRKSKNIYKTWLSEWKPENDDSDYWTTEEIVMSGGLGKVIIKNQNNSDGYQWKAKCDLIEHKYLIGSWKSLKKEAHASGTVMLTISPQGDFMFGQFTGPNDNGLLKSGDFVIGKDSQAISKAKKWIEDENNKKTPANKV